MFGFLKYCNDNERLKSFIDENIDEFSVLQEEIYDVISILSNSKSFYALKYIAEFLDEDLILVKKISNILTCNPVMNSNSIVNSILKE